MERIETPGQWVRKYYKDVDAGDIDGVVSCVTEDAVYDRPGYASWKGIKALELFYRGERMIARGSHELHQVYDLGNRVIVEGTFTGVLRNGSGVEVRFADFFHGPGRVSYRRTYFYEPSI